MSRSALPSRLRPMRAAAVLALLGLGGCKEIPEVAYETDHFEIAPDFDYPVCAGTLAYFEEHLAFVESSLARTVPYGERIRFYWITRDLDSWCRSRASGCYYPGTRVIVGTGASVNHEIVHAVLNAEAQTNLFLEEGVAEVFSGAGAYHHDVFDTRPEPGELLWLSPTDYLFGELDYAVASHFMAYVHHSYGAGVSRGIADVVVTGAGPPELEKVFERYTGVSFAELEAKYDAHARSYYRGLREFEIQKISDARWLDVSLRCNQESTFGPLPDGNPGMYRTLRVELDEPLVVDLDFLAPEDMQVEIVDIRRERSAGVVVDFFHPRLSGAREHPILHGGDSASLRLRAGTHLLVFSRAGYEYTDAFVQVTQRDFPRVGETPE